MYVYVIYEMKNEKQPAKENMAIMCKMKAIVM
jgi:hypothetical protein